MMDVVLNFTLILFDCINLFAGWSEKQMTLPVFRQCEEFLPAAEN